MLCSHGKLYCEPCEHVSTELEVTHYFAEQLAGIYTSQTAGPFTFVGLLHEYNKQMRRAEMQ